MIPPAFSGAPFLSRGTVFPGAAFFSRVPSRRGGSDGQLTLFQRTTFNIGRSARANRAGSAEKYRHPERKSGPQQAGETQV
jgi:hypothetical protein